MSMNMSRRWKLTALLPLVFAIVMMSTPWSSISAEQSEEQAPAQAFPAIRTERPPQTNGAPGGTPIKQNPNVNRPLTNDGMSSNPVRYMQQLLGSYGPIGMGNDYPNPYRRIEPWGELPANYDGIMPAPIGVEGGPDGLVYTLLRCRENGCLGQPQNPIVVWDLQGKLVRSFGAGLYSSPHGLAVDHENNVWTADRGNSLVRKWSKDGELLMTIGTEDVSDPNGLPNVFFQPTDVVVDAEGFVYVSNSHQKRGPHAFVAKYSPDGEFIKNLAAGPKGGNAPGELDEPHSMAIDIRGRLFISDRSNNRIQIWDREGNYITEWRQFSRPSGIYITSDDRIYVFDSESYGVDNPGWQKGFRVGNALTGVVSYYAQDAESRDYVHSGPEGGGVDSEGNVYAAVVRRRQMERHEPPTPQPGTRNAAWGPYQPNPAAVPYPAP